MWIRRALLSVSDKTGIVEFARELSHRGVQLLSTGGTHEALVRAAVPVTAVETYTGSPEVMDGRVKTLHPRIHGGLLARQGQDEADLEKLGAGFIDLCVVNLYPFVQTRARGNATRAELIEKIDIGGPCLLRASAKNHDRVGVVCDPSDYPRVLETLGGTAEQARALRVQLAAKAFAHTAEYDRQVAAWFQEVLGA